MTPPAVSVLSFSEYSVSVPAITGLSMVIVLPSSVTSTRAVFAG